jgi:protein-disulfide isomerase
VEYGAYGCHSCRLLHEDGVIEEIIAQYGEQVKFVFRNFPFLAPHDPVAAEAAQCAFDQGNQAFWALHNAIFDLTDFEYANTTTPEQYVELGRSVGLDADALDACLTASTHEITMIAWAQHGQEIGVIATPTFFLNGEFVTPNDAFTRLPELVAAALGQ